MAKAKHACDIAPRVGAVIELDTKHGKCTGTVKSVHPRPNCWVANVVPTEPRPDKMDPQAEWVLESAEGHRWDYIEGAPTVSEVIPSAEPLPPEPGETVEDSSTLVKGRKRKFDWGKAFILFDAGKKAAEVAKELGCTSVNAHAIKKKWLESKGATVASASTEEPIPAPELSAEPASAEPTLAEPEPEPEPISASEPVLVEPEPVVTVLV